MYKSKVKPYNRKQIVLSHNRHNSYNAIMSSDNKEQKELLVEHLEYYRSARQSWKDDMSSYLDAINRYGCLEGIQLG